MTAIIEQWLRIEPLDTLFFKGAEPMIAGVNHEVGTIFPPMPQTLVGAIRGAILGQRRIDPQAFMAGTAAEARQHPLLGTPEAAGFRVLGPLFEVEQPAGGSVLLCPAPAHWLADLDATRPGEPLRIQTARPMAAAVAALGLASSTSEPLLVPEPASDRLRSLAGWWANPAAFAAVGADGADVPFLGRVDDLTAGPAILPLAALAVRETRVGIALTPGLRRVRQGHLYGTTHVRLCKGVRLVAGLSARLAPVTLDRHGILQLGGEQRVASYQCLDQDAFRLPAGAGGWAVALMPVPWRELASSALAGLPRASGPLLRMGGWDMKERFHKPTTAYLPAGTAIRRIGGEAVPFGFIGI
ncbi:MAG: type III-B CRISPR module-associated Cmr3 family protein [Candidatus Latescibacterota bacterium]